MLAFCCFPCWSLQSHIPSSFSWRKVDTWIKDPLCKRTFIPSSWWPTCLSNIMPRLALAACIIYVDKMKGLSGTAITVLITLFLQFFCVFSVVRLTPSAYHETHRETYQLYKLSPSVLEHSAINFKKKTKTTN